MNRIIKFRAWDKEMQMMCYPKAHYVVNGNVATQKEKDRAWSDQPIGEIYNPEENEYHILFTENERFMVMQYTGLKDKNGVEIYEGDIYAIYYQKDGKDTNDIFMKGEVKWGFYNIGVNGYEYDFQVAGPLIEDEYLYQRMIDQEGHIIGNIHEHPHLLEGEKS